VELNVEVCDLRPVVALERKEEQEELKKKLEQLFRKRWKKKWSES
jgi:hypothetical protein